MGTDWSDLNGARAAVADPQTPTSVLLAICLAQPSLCAEAALHPAADGDLLSWLSRHEDPIVAATAQAHLATMPIASVQPAAQSPGGGTFVSLPVYQPVVPAAAAGAPAQAYPLAASWNPSPNPAPHRRRSLFLSLVAAVAVLAVVVGGVVVFLPRFLGGQAYTYAPDFRERPGIRAVDAQAGLPSDDGQTWSTNFSAAPGTNFMVAYNSTSAFSDYRQKVAEYNAAVAAYKEWETDYTAGYRDGKTCLTKTDQNVYSSSMQEYCSYSFSDNSSVQTYAARAGFDDAVLGLVADPANPGSAYESVPTVPGKPKPPSIGDNLVGIELKTAKVAWTLDLAKVWPGVQPSGSPSNVDGGRMLLVLDDPSAEESKGDRMLAILDIKTGGVTSSHLFSETDLRWASLHGDLVVVTDDEGGLRGISAADLATQEWSTSAQATVVSEEGGYGYGLTPPPGYLLTADGYIKLSDGSRATFARDAGQDGIQLTILNGTASDLIRVEPTDDLYDIAGFDAGSNNQTWRLHDQQSMPTRAGGLLLAIASDEVVAYNVNGSDLEQKWRYSCPDHCSIGFSDDSRVFVQDYGRNEVQILKTADGTETDRVKDESGYGPVVGKSVMYLRTGDRLVAYGLDKTGTPTLWRSSNVSGWLANADGVLVLQDFPHGILGVIGMEGDDWNAFKPTSE